MDSNYIVNITVEDEGFFKKSFKVHAGTNLKRLLDHCLDHICTQCSNTGMIEFWYNTVKLGHGQTPYILGMHHGDIINMVVTDSCSRGVCPLPSYQTAPNLHYLSQATRAIRYPRLFKPLVYHPIPTPRIRLKFQSQDNYERIFYFKLNDRMGLAMQAFASFVGREIMQCRFLFEGQRIVEDKTPIDLDLQGDDLIQVLYEVLGG